MGIVDRLRQAFLPVKAEGDKKEVEKEGFFDAALVADGLIAVPQSRTFLDWLTLTPPKDLQKRYEDYEAMDMTAEVSASLDIYADDATQPNSEGRAVWIKCSDKKIEDELNRVIDEIGLQENIWGIARDVAKYGNAFEAMMFDDSKGVVGLLPLPAAKMRVLLNKQGKVIGYIYLRKRKISSMVLPTIVRAFKIRSKQRQNGGKTEKEKDEIEEIKAVLKQQGVSLFEPYEIIHFKLVSRRQSVYGYSILEGNRWTYRYLRLMEDSLLIHKLTRANPRYVIYYDMGNLTGEKALRFAQEIRMQFKRRRFVNPVTGNVDLQFNPFSNEDDIFIPLTKEREKTRVDVLATPEINWVDDVEYFRKKQQSALKVPQRYLGGEEAPGRSTLSQEDMRFARTIMRIQASLKAGIQFLCNVHLIARGLDNWVDKFTVQMEPPSAIFELARAEVLSTKVDVVSRLAEIFTKRYAMQRVFGLTNKEIDKLMKERQIEKEQEAIISAVANAKAEKEASKIAGGEGGGGGGRRGLFMSIEKGSSLSEKREKYEGDGKASEAILDKLEEFMQTNKRIEDRLTALERSVKLLYTIARRQDGKYSS